MAFVISEASGSFANLGGSINALELDALDFERGRVALLELAGYLENLQAPLRLSKKIAIDDMKVRFETEIDPDGAQWQDLSYDYEPRKETEVGFVHPILTRSGKLKKAATSSSAWTVTADSIFFNTESLPEYWPAHQFGKEETFSVSGSEVLGIEGGEQTVGMPARPFIGLSADAEDEIVDAFDLWFAKGLDTITKDFAVSSSGTLQTRTAGGQFGPKPIIG